MNTGYHVSGLCVVYFMTMRMTALSIIIGSAYIEPSYIVT